MFEQVVTENQNLRRILLIRGDEENNYLKIKSDLVEMERQNIIEYSSLNEDFNREGLNVKLMLEKAISNTQKRKMRHEIAQENIIDIPGNNVHLLPNKEAAHKNMKPKTVYLLGSPDGSDEEEEDEDEQQDVVKNVKNQYLL